MQIVTLSAVTQLDAKSTSNNIENFKIELINHLVVFSIKTSQTARYETFDKEFGKFSVSGCSQMPTD